MTNSHTLRKLARILTSAARMIISDITTDSVGRRSAGGRVPVPLMGRLGPSLFDPNYSCMEKGKLRPAIEGITLADRVSQCSSSTRPAPSKWLS